MAEFRLEIVDGKVRAVPAQGDFVFVEQDGKAQVVGVVVVR